jgi:hypothetical protein
MHVFSSNANKQARSYPIASKQTCHKSLANGYARRAREAGEGESERLVKTSKAEAKCDYTARREHLLKWKNEADHLNIRHKYEECGIKFRSRRAGNASTHQGGSLSPLFQLCLMGDIVICYH